MSRWGDIAVVNALSLAACLAIASDIDVSAIRGLSGILLGVVIPGYAAMLAGFPEKTPAIAEQVVYSVGMSVVLVMLTGLALNGTTGGLEASRWACALETLTLFAGAVTLLRRRNLSQRAPSARGSVGLSLAQVVLVAIGMLGIGEAIAAVSAAAGAAPRESFVQLWMLPVIEDARPAVNLGVQNMELEAGDFEVRVEQGGKEIADYQLGILEPGGTWSVMVAVTTACDATGDISARLFRRGLLDQSERQVTIRASAWSSVMASGGCDLPVEAEP